MATEKEIFEKQQLKQDVKKPECKWCKGETRALNNNGVLGPGYREWNYVCKDCGKSQ